MLINEPWLVPDPDEYDGFYEESQFDEMIYELKDALKKSVKREFTDKIKELEEELAELREFKDQKESYDREMKNLKFKLEQAEKSVEIKAAKIRLREIADVLAQDAWIADSKWEYVLPKCDKCDDNRKIHFKSPLGKDMEEYCTCSDKMPKYRPVKAEIVEISQSSYVKDQELGNIRLKYITDRAFAKRNSGEDDPYEIQYVRVYDGCSFNDSKMGCGRVYFRDKDDCQRYCDYLTEEYAKNHKPMPY